MKGIRTAITVLALAAVATVTLTACSGSPSAEDYENYDKERAQQRHDQMVEYYPLEPELVYISAETGEITQVISYDKTVIFDEKSSKSDILVDPDEYWGSGGSDNNTSTSIASTIVIDGKSYPLSVTLDWAVDTIPLDEQVALYNAQLAKFDGTRPVDNSLYDLGPYTFESRAYAAKAEEFSATLGAAGLSASFQVTGRTVTVADERIVAGDAADRPAWEVLQEITGSPVSSEQYYYNNLCATYDVALVNEDAIISAAQTIGGDQLYGFNVSVSKTQLLLETEQPCSIEPFVSTTGQGKDYSNAPTPNDPYGQNDGTVDKQPYNN